jgi:hypothetical protein
MLELAYAKQVKVEKDNPLVAKDTPDYIFHHSRERLFTAVVRSVTEK